jgi:UDP-glucose 4-epimerase
VVHLAARVHFIRDPAPDPLALFRRINTDATLALARQAARHGVARFVFASTIGVNGQHTDSRPFLESDTPDPTTPYSISKWEAEQGLAQIAAETAMQVVVIRPPLVYGPWVKGNFLRLMSLARRRLPLPLASVANLRSFVYVGNLVSAIEKVLDAELPGITTYLVSDDHDLSLPQILREIGVAMNIEPRLVPFPPWLLMAAGSLVGKREEIRRLVESLRVDCSRIKHDLHWHPPYAPAYGIADAVAWFLGTGAYARAAPA